MNEYRVTLVIKTEEEFTPKEIDTLILEQWENTASAMEGDIIVVENVIQIRDSK